MSMNPVWGTFTFHLITRRLLGPVYPAIIYAEKSPTTKHFISFNSNIQPNSAFLGDIFLQNLSDLEFNLSWSIKAKPNDAVGIPMTSY